MNPEIPIRAKKLAAEFANGSLTPSARRAIVRQVRANLEAVRTSSFEAMRRDDALLLECFGSELGLLAAERRAAPEPAVQGLGAL